MTFAILMIYLAGVATTVHVLSAIAATGTVLGLTFLISSWIDNSHDEEAVIKLKKWIKLFFGGLAVSAFMVVFIPSEKTFYMLAGADVAGQVVDKASPMLNKTLELIEMKIDEELKGTKQEKQENN